MSALEGKHAVITGAGAGIGRAIALRFAREGAHVTLADIRLENAQAVADEIAAQGGRALAAACDVADQSAVEGMIAAAREAFGPVDILVNNAGGAIVGGEMQRFCECDRTFIDKLIGVNLMGTIFCTRAVVQEMKQRRSGKIINFSSIRGVAGDRNNILYGTAKGAIIAFTKSLAMEMGEYGVTVNSIAPGAIASRQGPASQRTLLGHPGRCEDVAALALLLAGDEGSFITGQNIIIDGGRTCGCLGD